MDVQMATNRDRSANPEELIEGLLDADWHFCDKSGKPPVRVLIADVLTLPELEAVLVYARKQLAPVRVLKCKRCGKSGLRRDRAGVILVVDEYIETLCRDCGPP